jgi:hypothetical protein
MHVIDSIVGTSPVWTTVRVVVIVFTASALVRLIPLPRRDPDRPAGRGLRRPLLIAASLAVVVGVVAGCALDVATSGGPAQPALTVTDGAAAAAVLRPGVGVFVAGATSSYRPVQNWASLTGRSPGLVTYYSAWDDPFQVRFAGWARAQGAIPFVQMEPKAVSVAGIASGTSDSYLRSFAAAVKVYRYPVAVSFGPEANGPFYSWGCGHTSATSYVAAWRHVHAVMSAAGALNIIWTWDMNRIYHATCPLAARWPGSRYVDWIGVDGYWRSRGDTFASTLTPTIRAARKLAAKPVLIGETGARKGPGATGWVRSVFQGAEHTPGVVGFVWFNYGDRLGDYRLQDDRPALAVFRREARNYR